MPGILGGPWAPPPEFQSAPGREAGRCANNIAMVDEVISFNPRPAVRPGDAHGRVDRTQVGQGFNPRPAVRPGDALLPTIKAQAQAMFQSAPGREAGRCLRRRWATPPRLRFQSAPGREAGRCGIPARI